MICASTGEQCEIENWFQGRGNSVAMKVIFQTDRSFAAAMNRVTTVQFLKSSSFSVKCQKYESLLSQSQISVNKEKYLIVSNSIGLLWVIPL